MKSTIDIYLKDYKFSPILLNKLYYIFKHFPDNRIEVCKKTLELIFSNGNEYKLYVHTLEMIDYLRVNGVSEVLIDSQLYNLNDMRSELISYKKNLFNRLKNLHKVNYEEILNKELTEYDEEDDDDGSNENYLEERGSGAYETEEMTTTHENNQISASSIDLYYQDSIDKLCGIIKSQDYDRMIDDDEEMSNTIGVGGIVVDNNGNTHADNDNNVDDNDDDDDNDNDDNDDEMREDDFNVPKFKNDFSEDDEMVGLSNTTTGINYDLNSKFLQTYKLIESKNILKLMIFNSSVNIINDNNYFFVKLLDEKLTNLFKSFIIRDFYKIILFKSYDYKINNMIDFYNRKLENLFEISQQEDEDIIEEDLESNDGGNKSIDNNNNKIHRVSRSEESDISIGIKLNQEEVIAYYNCKFLLIYLYFNINDYNNVVKEFEKLNKLEINGGIKNIKPFQDILNNDNDNDNDKSTFQNILIYKNYLIYCILFSIILCKTNFEFEKIINNTEIFKNFLKFIETKEDDESKKVFIQIIDSYLNCDFKKLFKLITDLNSNYLSYDYQLFKSCENFKVNLRRKCIIFYISTIEKVKISKIKEKFYDKEDNIKTDELINELNYLIKIMNFKNIKINEINMTIELLHGKNDKDTSNYENLVKINQIYQNDYESIKLNVMMQGF